jgi:hypothetical protein
MAGGDAGTTAGAAGFGSRVADANGARPMAAARQTASPLSIVIIRRVRDLRRRAEVIRAGDDE